MSIKNCVIVDSLGKRLRNLRALLPEHPTVKKVSDAIGISYNTLSAYERDERSPDAKILVLLADYYNTTCDYIVRGLSPENVKIGKETGLSEEALSYLAHLHRTAQPLAEFMSFILEGDCAGTINTYVDTAIKKMDCEGPYSELSELYQIKAQRAFAQVLERYVNYKYLGLHLKERT